MSITEKYNKIRSSIKHGDTILFHGEKIISNIINTADNSYWNHIGIILEVSGVLFIIDSNAGGVQPERLSVRIKSYEDHNGDFKIRRSMKPIESINTALYNVMQNLEDTGVVKYDFINGAKSLVNRFFKTKLKIKEKTNVKICSMFVKPYEVELDMIFNRINPDSLFFPQDFKRYEKNVNHVCNL